MSTLHVSILIVHIYYFSQEKHLMTFASFIIIGANQWIMMITEFTLHIS